MTFKEFYKTHKLGWYCAETLPKDVREDLFQLLEDRSRHIGVIIYPAAICDGEIIRYEGLRIGYYWRTLKPVLTLEPWKWFWRIKRVKYIFN